MVTNADGTFTVQTLTQLGIASIDLKGDATHIELPDGSVITAQSTYTTTGGATHTIADVSLAYDDQSYRVERTETTDGSGNLVVEQTGYTADGSIAFMMETKTGPAGYNPSGAVVFTRGTAYSPIGHLIENRYDDDGDGVFDRIQRVSTLDLSATLEVKTVENYVGADLASGIKVNKEVTETDDLNNEVRIYRYEGDASWYLNRAGFAGGSNS